MDIYATAEKRHYIAQLEGYQVMPNEELFTFQCGELEIPASQIMSHQSARVQFTKWGEEILYERGVFIKSYCASPAPMEATIAPSWDECWCYDVK